MSSLANHQYKFLSWLTLNSDSDSDSYALPLIFSKAQHSCPPYLELKSSLEPLLMLEGQLNKPFTGGDDNKAAQLTHNKSI